MEKFDVVIVGGSYAGLSAALLLGRSMRRVLVLDGQRPCNRQTPHSHSFLTRDGAPPAALAATARAEVLQYPTVEIRIGIVTSAQREADGFRVQTEAGETVQGRKLLLATGVQDELPELPGVAACWGISVLHCPYCHGYEVRGRQLGLLANGDAAADMVSHIRNWSSHLTVFTNGPATLSPRLQDLLRTHQVRVVEQPLAELEHQAGQVHAVRTTDGQRHQMEAMFAHFPTRLPGTLHVQLGCNLTESGHIQVSEFGETGVPGLFAAGDATTPMRQVAAAVAQAAKVGVWINRELIAEGIYADEQTLLP